MKGTIDLRLRLGTLELVRRFVVVDRLRVNANLGTDTLKAFRGVIDLDENTVTLKSTCEVFRLRSRHSARMNSSVRLRPGGQALVVTDVYGSVPEGTTVLVEGNL
ncbi:hypothetical protein PHMEG_00018439 [Phytophthora megakarya]|uniref:Uncharacterized protein n=1 Tax=Phytophthora megakarya TaxID=4795 RepID=A0A225VVC7_9STRA|nr:hypothetical protein PHMEG_00018439 [Phytophthora megakarya]